MADSSGALYFVDSHSHTDNGAPPGNGVEFADCVCKMMDFHLCCALTLGSVNEVIYSYKLKHVYPRGQIHKAILGLDLSYVLVEYNSPLLTENA